MVQEDDPAANVTGAYAIFYYADPNTLPEVTTATQEIVEPTATRVAKADVSACPLAPTTFLDPRL